MPAARALGFWRGFGAIERAPANGLARGDSRGAQLGAAACYGGAPVSASTMMTHLDTETSRRAAAPEGLATPWPAAWTAARVIDVLEPLVLERRRTRLEEVIGGRLGSVTLLLDELSDPHNRAAIVRSCDAFGVQELHSVQPARDFSVHHGVAAGTERWVDVNAHADARCAVEHLVGRGYELIQTHPSGELTPDQLAEVPRVALILGNEHRGIDPVFVSAASRSVRIPMRGFVESLNVSVSAAVLLAAATRGRSGDLDSSARQHLYARALYHTVPRATEVLEALEQRRAGSAPPG